jgi:hypothetical protein
VVTTKDRLIAGIMELTEERLLQAVPSELLSEWLDVLAAFDCCLTLESKGKESGKRN